MLAHVVHKTLHWTLILTLITGIIYKILCVLHTGELKFLMLRSAIESASLDIHNSHMTNLYQHICSSIIYKLKINNTPTIQYHLINTIQPNIRKTKKVYNWGSKKDQNNTIIYSLQGMF